MTYYLKYRPQTIAALDLVSVRRELGGILSSGRFAHAYLFAGPRGTGKTSAARILAKVVNCERNRARTKDKKGSRSLAEPCNKCLTCRSITDGTALDLLEIDAASNRGIDDIRELRERIKLAPAKASFKVYIIDEVHMLTTEAFNALLKTLEEPPSHALFILCTTVPEKLPETVVSRCTRITFQKASESEIVSSLKKVVRGEKFKVEKGVLMAIAQSADGSFRDGMKLLEQVSLRLSGKKGKRRMIRNSHVHEVAGLTYEGEARRLLELLSLEKTEAALREISKASQEKSLELYTREVLELLRRLLLTEVGVMQEDRIEGLELKSIRRLIVLFSAAARSLRTTVIPELPLELAIVEWIDFAKSKREGISNKPISTNTRVSTEESKQGKSKVSFSKIQDGWSKVLEKVKPQNHSLEALLKASSPKKLDGELLIIEVAYPFHKEQLELTRYKKLVEAVVVEVFSAPLRLRYTLGETPQPGKLRKKHENISGAVDDERIIRAAEEIFGSKRE